MFIACGIWCLADVSSVSPSSEQTLLCMMGKGEGELEGVKKPAAQKIPILFFKSLSPYFCTGISKNCLVLPVTS